MKGQDLSGAIEMAACSDAGRVRSHNEDSVLTNAALGLAALADGMGGYNAGEVASDMATAVLDRGLRDAFAARASAVVGDDGQAWVRSALIDVIGRANAAIHLAAQSDPSHAGMGTTLAMAQFFDNRVMVAHIGDSRLYRWREGEMQLLTRDHSLLQQQIDSGLLTPEQARASHNKNLVTRALGVEAGVDAEIAAHEVRPGDVYLLCSDGLNDMLEDDVISDAISGLSANLPLCAALLVQMANDNGGRDNVSVILTKILAPFPAKKERAGFPKRIQSWFKTFEVRKDAQDG